MEYLGMIVKSLKVQNRLGIHARPAGLVVDITSRASSEVYITYEGTRANAKSILNVMMLAITPGSTVQFEIDGDDEEGTMKALEELFDARFHEDDAEQ
jgi:phosphocarrier protein HPr